MSLKLLLNCVSLSIIIIAYQTSRKCANLFPIPIQFADIFWQILESRIKINYIKIYNIYIYINLTLKYSQKGKESGVSTLIIF